MMLKTDDHSDDKNDNITTTTTTIIMRLNRQISDCINQINQIEMKVLGNNGVERLKKDLLLKKVYSARLEKVPSNYYDFSLQERAKLLRVSPSQLCKSIIFENTACDHFDFDDHTNSRYYCVIIQYEAKFDAELLRTFIHELRELKDRLPKKRFHFVLANEEISHLLTGFGHNAISPYGMLVKIPMIICSRCVSVSPSYIYLGGGEVNIKVGLSIDDFIRSTSAMVAKISESR